MQYTLVKDNFFPLIGLGLSAVSGNKVSKVVKWAIESGYEYLDTAYRYGNEQEIGEVISLFKECNSIRVSTKLSELQYIGRRRFLYFDRVSPRKAIKEAEKRLRKKKIDLYLLHSPFKGYEDAYEELLSLQKNNLVGLIGVSGFNVSQLNNIKERCGVYPQVCMVEMHPLYNPRDMIHFCKFNNIALIARSPFAHGIILHELDKKKEFVIMKKKYAKTVPQLILRWIIQQGIIALPRSQNFAHIKDNINIFDFELSNDEMSYIDSLNQNISYGVV